MGIEKVSAQVGEHEIAFETGRMAKQAYGSVTVQCGGTVILATAVAKTELDENKDFFPLTVDYRERTYAAGKFPGGYFKREGRPTEREILTCRLIDRPIRSLFSNDYQNETQIIITVMSSDGENPPDMLAMNGASAALLLSDIPFEDTMAAVRVGLVDGTLVINPTIAQMETSDLDLVLAANAERIVMIEAGAKEITEEKMTEALKFGHEHAKTIIKAQNELRKKAGKKKWEIEKKEIPAEIVSKVQAATKGKYEKVFDLPSKEEREAGLDSLYKDTVLAAFDQEAEDFDEKPIKKAFYNDKKEYVREMILDANKRPDGRGFRDIREITCEVGVLPRTHGSSLFTRGQTQSLGVTTLGTGDDEQRIDTLEGDVIKTFMLHYNFPPFSVGEVGRTAGPGRREIGHGALAERSLAPVIPDQEKFPYTIRLVSDILESNGSSSMASVCAGTLALMDAGVPLTAPVSGIAIGLITGDKGRWKVLTDIAGMEDFLGDMDFKAAGTSKGLTALQMDMKIAGISDEILAEAFDQAKEARMKILDKITQAIAEPRKEISEFAPRITAIKINPEKIGALIGPGGKNIRRICEETGAKIDIEDDGTVHVSSVEAAASEAALQQISLITAEAEVGKIYEGPIKKLMAFGAFVEVLPEQDGLCHVSELSDDYVKDITEYAKVGQVIKVKVLGVEGGKISLSAKQVPDGALKQLPPDVERDVLQEPTARSGGRGRGGGDRSRGRR